MGGLDDCILNLLLVSDDSVGEGVGLLFAISDDSGGIILKLFLLFGDSIDDCIAKLFLLSGDNVYDSLPRPFLLRGDAIGDSMPRLFPETGSFNSLLVFLISEEFRDMIKVFSVGEISSGKESPGILHNGPIVDGTLMGLQLSISKSARQSKGKLPSLFVVIFNPYPHPSSKTSFTLTISPIFNIISSSSPGV
jgi:hypothetical protein